MIRLVYPTDPNFGDAMSPLIVAKLSGQKVVPSGMWNADMMAVGSVFYRGDSFMADTYHAKLKRRIKAVAWDFRRVTSRPVIVWGSGFLQYPPIKQPHIMRNFKVLALRGLYTRRILEKYGLMSSKEQVAYGDPGLLFAKLFDINTKKEYEWGVIPHMYDADLGWWDRIQQAMSKIGVRAHMIDAREDPVKVVSEIAKCERLMSSSLHGLIVADSLGIPSLHLGLSTLEFPQVDFELKFRDYYSALGEEMPPIIDGEDFVASPLKYLEKAKFHVPNTDKIIAIQEELMKASPF